MHLNEVTFTDAQPIDSYGPGFFRVAGRVLEGGLLLTEKGALSWGGYDDHEPLLELANDVDVLFVGTGSETAHLPADFRSRLEEVGLGIEAMATPAACRTFNVLLSEGRRIAAALIAV